MCTDKLAANLWSPLEFSVLSLIFVMKRRLHGHRTWSALNPHSLTNREPPNQSGAMSLIVRINFVACAMQLRSGFRGYAFGSQEIAWAALKHRELISSYANSRLAPPYLVGNDNYPVKLGGLKTKPQPYFYHNFDMLCISDQFCDITRARCLLSRSILAGS